MTCRIVRDICLELYESTRRLSVDDWAEIRTRIEDVLGAATPEATPGILCMILCVLTDTHVPELVHLHLPELPTEVEEILDDIYRIVRPARGDVPTSPGQ